MDPIFNYSRAITFDHAIRRIRKWSKPNNASFPWRTNDHALGLYSEVNLATYGDYKATYHESMVTDGSSYRFHSPYELPFSKTVEYISEPAKIIQFLVSPRISFLGESLMNDEIKKCGLQIFLMK